MPNREFTLNHKFEHFLKPECTPQLYSPEEEHFGVKWKISILQKGDRILIYLCADLTKNQEVHIQYNAKICANDNHDRRTDTIAAYSFSYENDFPSGWASIERRTLNHVFSNDGKLEVEFHVKIIKLIGYRKELRSFGEDMKQFSDAVLVVDEQKLYVSKLYLSSQSSHFANLFKRQVEESKKPEIMWTGINPYYLQYYLEVILGEDRIDEDTVEAELKISDKCNTLHISEKEM
ncbi:hypothetical protein B9Z55_007811 [Caenorhabditis nigoni]|uniref:BTB domain-containing protein n=1 Tax=Caenorhabditis nigoni TaxID=1611254 RepID=A0A2G5VBE1_9PELO|nr:hypothetical protein B9Z55_007811 [Caenorhabditis nigoni]